MNIFLCARWKDRAVIVGGGRRCPLLALVPDAIVGGRLRGLRGGSLTGAARSAPALAALGRALHLRPALGSRRLGHHRALLAGRLLLRGGLAALVPLAAVAATPARRRNILGRTLLAWLRALLRGGFSITRLITAILSPTLLAPAIVPTPVTTAAAVTTWLLDDSPLRAVLVGWFFAALVAAIVDRLFPALLIAASSATLSPGPAPIGALVIARALLARLIATVTALIAAIAVTLIVPALLLGMALALLIVVIVLVPATYLIG